MQTKDQKREKMSTALRYAEFIVMLSMFFLLLAIAETGLNMRADVFFIKNNSLFVYALTLVSGATGYFLYPLTKKITSGFKENYIHTAVLIILFLFFSVAVHASSAAIFVIFAALAMLLSGYVGALTFYYICLALAGSRFLFRIVSISMFICSILTYIIRIVCTRSSTLIFILLPVCAVYAYFIYIFPLNYSVPRKMSYSAASLDKKCTLLIVIIAAMATLLSIGENVLITDITQNTLDINDWPKLLYPLFLLIAGMFGDKNKTMLAVACLASMTLCALNPIFEQGGYAMQTVSGCIQYLAAAMCFVYMSASPIQTAQHTDYPSLWAGIGLYEKNLCVALFAVPVMFLNNQIPSVYIIIIDILLVALCAAAMLSSSKIRHDVVDRTDDAYNEFKLLCAERFAQKYELDEQETAVTTQLICGETSIKRIAFMMYLPEKSVFRLLASVYEKTKTENLNSLMRLYYMS